jgi:hypothetical protein
MKLFKAFLLSLLVIHCTNKSFGQTHEDRFNQLIPGKWKLEMMKDSTGTPIDIVSSGHQNKIPEVFSYIEFNKEKAIITDGRKKFNFDWMYRNGRLTFKEKETIVKDYKVISMMPNEFILEYKGFNEKGNIFKGYLTYKKVQNP